MNNLVLSAMKPISSFVEKVKNVDLTVFKRHIDLLEIVKSTPYETERVMGYLKHQPETWVVLREGEHPWYPIAKSGADTLLRHSLSVKQPIFLVHLQSRWLLIWEGEETFPAILLFADEARDGLTVSFYRIFGGAALSSEWQDIMNNLVKQVIASQPPPEKALPPTSPYVVLDLGQNGHH